ncbi:MAG: NPCBM/NEW2 domain-containing protein [Deltaproteobacteria bacterium]|nr:NPCBM/NEW2 domain-containing protein [Deltaproteobacteria bacterium]MDZ4345135.1 NPCBM/NEW2 domain-containing protein [Candidatus Binatia bacterium]
MGWTDNSTSEDGFKIERSPGSGTAFTQIATVGANVTSYIDGGLLDATTYCYRVVAFNTAGSSGFSNEGCATTAAAMTAFTLTVSKSGTGTGTVTATGISCGADCSEVYTSGTSVVLTATAAAGSTFSGWTGTGCGTGTVTINGTMTCTATFTSTPTGSVVYLSDLAWVSATSGWGPVERDRSNAELPAGDGRTLTIRGKMYAKGLGVHALSDITYVLNGKYSTFLADVGVDDEVFGRGSVVFQVWLDGAKQFDSGVVTGVSAVKSINVDVTGKTTLRLVVTDGGDGIGSDHADWADARLTPTTAVAPTSYSLTVSKSGTGTGTVAATGISCGADCSEVYTSGTSVVLTATAAGGSTFAGWSGGGCTGTGTCTVTMSAATTVTATFNLASGFALTVSVAVQATSGGSASGRVVSNPAGIDCGTDCSETYTSGLPVKLTPLPGTGSVFAGWTGNSDCTDGSVTMDANKSCIANFSLNQALLTVTTNGNGTVNSTSGGMTCSSSCTYPLSLGSTITVRATPSTGSSFSGWSGAGCSGTGDCNITLSTNQSVAATFVGSSSNPTDKIGVYRPSTGKWFLDVNGNGQWGEGDCGVVYCVSSFSSPEGVPVVGDRDGSGVSQLGMFRTDTAVWQLDRNGNETWEGCGVDICLGPYGQRTDIPITGRWNTSGYDRIGVFRPRTGKWYLDVNGNGKLNACDRDRCGYLKVFRMGDIPVPGDWSGDGITQLGLYRPSTGEWFLDYNGDRNWDGCTRDRCLSFGIVGQPVSGDWDGTGKSKIGVFDPRTGDWFLDLNGNGRWDGCEVDLCVTNFGQAGDYPVVGKW